jgi:hypothetical protein
MLRCSVRVVGLSIWLLVALVVCVHAEERMRAKLGIQINSNGDVRLAKATDPVKIGDRLRVYVLPAEDAYVYIVHNDGKQVVLLNANNAKAKTARGSVVILPELGKEYQIDGQSAAEYITVICSSQELPQVAKFFATPESSAQQQWVSLEKALMDDNKIELGQKEDIIQIAGNVRSIPKEHELLIEKLPIFSGKALLAKKYAFQVQK